MLGRIIETLSILLAGNLVISEGKSAVPLPVHGIINQSADLPIPVHQTGPDLEIYWTFETSFLAHVTNDKLKIIKETFENRLETLDSGRILRINNLRKEDGGLYSASIQFTDQRPYETSYSLTVYEPVPPPVIQTGLQEKTPERCNVTLHCSVPLNSSDFSYTWKYRHQDSAEYRLYNNGSIIQISLPRDHQDTEYLCIVQNPADQKNVSIIVKSCINTNRSRQHLWYSLFIILVFMVLIAGAITWKIRRKHIRKEEYYMAESHSIEPSPSNSQAGKPYGNTQSPEPYATMSGAEKEQDLLKTSLEPEETLLYGEVLHHSIPQTQEFKTLYTSLELKK